MKRGQVAESQSDVTEGDGRTEMGRGSGDGSGDYSKQSTMMGKSPPESSMQEN